MQFRTIIIGLLLGGLLILSSGGVAVASPSTKSLEAKYTARYGHAVGRWAGPALRAGWSKRDLDKLMYIIYRESRGQPRARNPYSACAGLLQLHPGWYKGWWWPHKFDPLDGPTNLYYGHKIYHKAHGWSPWSM